MESNVKNTLKNENEIPEKSQILSFEAIKKIREQLPRDPKESYISLERYF